MLQIQAVQLVNKNNVCKITSNGEQKILVVSADRWLAMLP